MHVIRTSTVAVAGPTPPPVEPTPRPAAVHQQQPADPHSDDDVPDVDDDGRR
jgi:hypothetical protein